MRRSITRSTLLAALLLALAVPVPAKAATNQTIVLAGGCFWGMEAVFGALKGVSSSVPGYAGGSKATAHYELVSTGTTGHAESVQVTFDPAQISYDQILTVYFTVAHDPTELNFQGPDSGTQYRSAIFYANDEQRKGAEAAIARLTAAKRFTAPIVTKLEPNTCTSSRAIRTIRTWWSTICRSSQRCTTRIRASSAPSAHQKLRFANRIVATFVE
jgi:methionine-S-sulfoxide reductase